MPEKTVPPDDPMFHGGFEIFSPLSARLRRREADQETKPTEEPADQETKPAEEPADQETKPAEGEPAEEKPVRTGPPSLLDDEETYERIMDHFSSSFYADCGDDLAILGQIEEFWRSHPRLTVDDIMRLSESYLGPNSPHRGNLWPPDPNDPDVYDLDAEHEDEDEEE